MRTTRQQFYGYARLFGGMTLANIFGPGIWTHTWCIWPLGLGVGIIVWEGISFWRHIHDYEGRTVKPEKTDYVFNAAHDISNPTLIKCTLIKCTLCETTNSVPQCPVHTHPLMQGNPIGGPGCTCRNTECWTCKNQLTIPTKPSKPPSDLPDAPLRITDYRR